MSDTDSSGEFQDAVDNVEELRRQHVAEPGHSGTQQTDGGAREAEEDAGGEQPAPAGNASSEDVPANGTKEKGEDEDGEPTGGDDADALEAAPVSRPASVSVPAQGTEEGTEAGPGSDDGGAAPGTPAAREDGASSGAAATAAGSAAQPMGEPPSPSAAEAAARDAERKPPPISEQQSARTMEDVMASPMSKAQHEDYQEDAAAIEQMRNRIVNQDTGEVMDLSEFTEAFDTQRYTTFDSFLEAAARDREAGAAGEDDADDDGGGSRSRRAKLKGRLGALFSKRRKGKGETRADGTVSVELNRKSVHELENMRECQVLQAHTAPVWTMEFSLDGAFLASGGQDAVIHLWRVAPPPPGASDTALPVVEGTPYRSYKGHTHHVVDLAWSSTGFLLSASADKTVRLWHATRPDCLCLFQHPDVVASVAFHPVMDGYFLSGAFDKKLRVWNIPDGRVAQWCHTPEMVSAVAYEPSGRLAVAGLLNGLCVFYQSNVLTYYTQVECRNRHGRLSDGRKVTGISFLQGGKQVLVSTNDSRSRLLNMDDFSMQCKFKGVVNRHMQIRCTASESEAHVICGSDDNRVCMWRTKHDLYEPQSTARLTGYRRDRNSSYEWFRPHEAGDIVTVTQICKSATVAKARPADQFPDAQRRAIIVTASNRGEIKFFEATATGV